MGAFFPKLCLWRRNLCSNLGGIGLEKLYRATLSDLTKLSLSFNTNTQEATVALGYASQTSRVLNISTYAR